VSHREIPVAMTARIIIITASLAFAVTTNASPAGGLPTVGPTDEMRLEQAISDMTVLDTLGAEIQPRLLEESQRAQRHCESNISLSDYYDCVCYAAKFLEARVDHGPEENIIFTNFVREVDYKDCVDEPQIAEVNYQRCLQMISNTRFSPGQEEEICQCTGRNVAASFAARPLSSPRQVSQLFVHQMTACRRGIQ
jgi:hypothetical protein